MTTTEPTEADSPVSLLVDRLLAGESLPRLFRDADHAARASVIRFAVPRGRRPSDDWPRLVRTAERFAAARIRIDP